MVERHSGYIFAYVTEEGCFGIDEEGETEEMGGMIMSDEFFGRPRDRAISLDTRMEVMGLRSSGHRMRGKSLD